MRSASAILAAATVMATACSVLAQTEPLVKQGHWEVHYVPFCIHKEESSNGYIGNCIQPGDDIIESDIEFAILEAVQIWNRYGLADVELYYTGSCGALAWPADDNVGDGPKTACTDVADGDTVSEIGCSIDVDSDGNNGYTCLSTTDVDADGTRNGNRINEFSIWLQARNDWTRDLAIVDVENLIDRTITHEFGHTLGLRHITGPGGSGCNDASLLCESTNENIFFLYSDVNVLVNDSVGDGGEDAEGWNASHELRAWSVDEGQTSWVSRSNAFGASPEQSILTPAIGNRQTSAWYMVAWSRPGDAGNLRTAIGDGSAGSWSSSFQHSYRSFRSPAVARRGTDSRWIMAWRWPGTATNVNRYIYVRDHNGTQWNSVYALQTRVDSWSTPSLAYHSVSDRYIVGWVHSGVEGDPLSDNRFARFRTRPAGDDTLAWSSAVEIWADEDSDGVVDTGEELIPWDTFDIDCATAGNVCNVIYVEANNLRYLRAFQISVDANGSISYVVGSRVTVDASWYRAGASIALNSSTGEVRAMGLRAATGYNQYNYPVYKTRHRINGTWGTGQFFSWRDGAGPAAFTFNDFHDEWMSVNLEGDTSNDQ